jgi:hypothetical protein
MLFLTILAVTLIEAAPCSVDWHGECQCELYQYKGHRYVVISKNGDVLAAQEILPDGTVVIRYRAPKRYWI